ncbi:TRAP transporter substrate-binding protein [Thalassobacillus sp. CUG 92003]|uniref:TRAP transporter substrate-binding protein n=1 Tax=Thalassobacillus sp. CUG 92003 TaxID=2736641 RepID=UPI0015E69E46|nr:TRAP transporter substrate-binding protein [Thalassobacillus sp. CUG 92003]
MHRRLSFLMTLFVIMLVATACGGYSNPNKEAAEEPVSPLTANTSSAAAKTETDGDVLTLRLGHQTPKKTNYHRASVRFKELVEEKTNGKVRIEIYPFRELGTDRELLEAMQFGTLDLGMISGPPLAGFAPKASVLDLPYLFKDWEHVNNFLGSDVEKEYRSLMEEVNLKIFGTMARGFRHVTTSNGPIKSPGDFNGKSLRVIESPVYVDSYKALGASPQSMNFGDAYTALEQGAIDGQENTIDIVHDENVFEVNEHVSKTGVHFVFGFLMASKDRFDSWPEDVQKAILESGEQAIEVTNEENEVHEEKYENILKEEKGMQVHEVDKEPFKEKVEVVYEDWIDEYGNEMLKKIQSLEEE